MAPCEGAPAAVRRDGWFSSEVPIGILLLSRGGHKKQKKRLLWEVSSVQVQAVKSCLYDVRATSYADRWGGLPASLTAARLPHAKRTRAAEHMCGFLMLRFFPSRHPPRAREDPPWGLQQLGITDATASTARTGFPRLAVVD